MATPKDIDIILSELVRKVNESGRRMRILEERSASIENRLNSLEEAILRNAENSRGSLEKIENHFKGLDASMLKAENDLGRITKEMEKTAKRIELKELENLISLYNPIKSRFVTKEEVLRMLKERG